MNDTAIPTGRHAPRELLGGGGNGRDHKSQMVQNAVAGKQSVVRASSCAEATSPLARRALTGFILSEIFLNTPFSTP
jgi:hypothetical protein